MKHIYVFTNASAPSESTTRSLGIFPSLSVFLSFFLALCFPYLPSISSLLVIVLLKRPFPYCFFGKYRGTFVVITLQRVRDNSARRELSKFIRPMRSRRYESPLDRPTRNFIRYTPGRPRRMLRGISRQRARTDEHNHRAVPLE